MSDFLFLCQFAENDGFQVHPCPYKGHKLIIFDCCIIFHGVYVPHFPSPVYESGEHHSQQTDTRTENEILRILNHRRVTNNENTWTQGGEHHTLGAVEGWKGRESIGTNI